MIQIDLREIPTKCLHRGFSDKRRNVSPHETIGVLQQPFHLEIIADRHAARVDVDDFRTSVLIWDADLKFSIKTARSSKSGVYGISPVRGPDHHDIIPALHSIQQGEELGNNSSFDLATDVLPLWCNGVKLIDEDDSRGVGGGLVENLA